MYGDFHQIDFNFLSHSLQNRKRPLGSSPGGLSVDGLKGLSNISINNKPSPLSQPVIFGNSAVL